MSSVFKTKRSASKRVLGNINDLVKHYEFYILKDGGVKECNMVISKNDSLYKQKTVEEYRPGFCD